MDKNAAEIEWSKLNKQVIELHNQGDIHRAVSCAEKALESARTIYLSDHEHLAISINNLAEMYRIQGKLSKAEPLYLESLAMYRLLSGDLDHNNLVSIINNLAEVYRVQGKLSKAESLCLEALAIRRQLYDEDNELATSINNLAGLYHFQGKLADAEFLYLESLVMSRRLYINRDHNDLAIRISNLA